MLYSQGKVKQHTHGKKEKMCSDINKRKGTDKKTDKSRDKYNKLTIAFNVIIRKNPAELDNVSHLSLV